LIDTFKQAIRAFTVLGKAVDEWDELLVYILAQKLDRHTRLAWETSLSNSKDTPKFSELCKYLENRIHALEAVNTVDPILGSKGDSKKSDQNNSNSRSKPKVSVNIVATSEKKTKGGGRTCDLCSEKHPLFKCNEFKKLSAVEKRN